MDHFCDFALSPWTVPGLQKPFTLRRANRALVLVRRIVADVVADFSRMQELQEILELEQQFGSLEYLRQVHQQMVAVAGRLRGCLEELAAVGVVLRDFARGVVDFPARVAGRDICFCWRLGEQAVQHWHRPNEGLAERKPISELVGSVVPSPVKNA